MTKTLLILAPLFATAAIAAGCGGGSDNDPPPAAVAEATAAPADTSLPTESPETSAESEVKMAGSAFAPATIDLEVGDTVSFVNDDGIAHTATSDAFDSGTMEPGADFAFTAEEPGAISYVCAFHPGMTGTINVT